MAAVKPPPPQTLSHPTYERPHAETQATECPPISVMFVLPPSPVIQRLRSAVMMDVLGVAGVSSMRSAAWWYLRGYRGRTWAGSVAMDG